MGSEVATVQRSGIPENSLVLAQVDLANVTNDFPGRIGDSQLRLSRRHGRSLQSARPASRFVERTFEPTDTPNGVLNR